MSAATWSGDHGGAEEAEADVGRGAINVRRESAATAARDGHGSIALLYAAGPLSKELPVAMQERVEKRMSMKVSSSPREKARVERDAVISNSTETRVSTQSPLASRTSSPSRVFCPCSSLRTSRVHTSATFDSSEAAVRRQPWRPETRTVRE